MQDGRERRRSPRYRVNLKARWEGLLTQGKGTVSDLSITGCFVLSGGETKTGELVRLEIYFPQEMASLWGEVVYTIAELGFAVQFTFAGEEFDLTLQDLVETRELVPT